MKKSRAPNPKRIVHKKPHSAPAVNAVAMHSAESIVKSMRNFKNIINSLFCASKVSSRVYNIYNIVHTRARNVKGNGGWR